MVSSVIHLDPFALRHTKTSLSVTVASNFSLRSLFEDFAVSDPDELLAGLEDGRINLSKAPICRLHISILEEEPIEDIFTPSLVNDVACFIQACSVSTPRAIFECRLTLPWIWDQLGIRLIREVKQLQASQSPTFKMEYQSDVPQNMGPPGTSILVLQHLTCTFSFHQTHDAANGTEGVRGPPPSTRAALNSTLTRHSFQESEVLSAK